MAMKNSNAETKSHSWSPEGCGAWYYNRRHQAGLDLSSKCIFCNEVLIINLLELILTGDYLIHNDHHQPQPKHR